MTDTYQGWPADVVERRARAIDPTCWNYGDLPRASDEMKLADRRRKAYERAVASLEADAAAGYVLVPREATEEMDLAMCEADHCDWSDSHAGDQSDSVRDIYNAAIAAGAVRKEG